MVQHQPSFAGAGFTVRHLGFRARERRAVDPRAAKLCVVLRGSLDTYVGGMARAADVVFHPARRRIRVTPGASGASVLSLDIDTDRTARFSSLLSGVQAPRLVHCSEALLLARRMRRELTRRDQWTSVVLEALALQLLVVIFRTGEGVSEPPEWLRRVQERIATCATDHRRLSEYAREAGVHPMHLARIFRQHVGVSVGEQVRRQRVDAAANLLATTDRALAEIAASTGFCDQGHLTRTFRRLLQISPSEYRRAHRSPER